MSYATRYVLQYIIILLLYTISHICVQILLHDGSKSKVLHSKLEEAAQDTGDYRILFISRQVRHRCYILFCICIYVVINIHTYICKHIHAEERCTYYIYTVVRLCYSILFLHRYTYLYTIYTCTHIQYFDQDKGAVLLKSILVGQTDSDLIAKYTVLAGTYCLLKYIENVQGVAFATHSMRLEYMNNINNQKLHIGKRHIGS